MEKENSYGWDADIDTTFALYKPNSAFSYKGLRLDRPYTIQHAPWYLDVCCISEEWQYYLEHVSGVSTWGSRIKNMKK